MIEFIRNIIVNIGFGWMFVLLILVAVYTFWHECKILAKDNNSIFDVWILSTIFMFVWGRLTFITSTWTEFMSSGWFYSPYEIYGDNIYWFRMLPWRAFAVWDGSFLFSGLLAGILIFAYLYVTFMKKWSWEEMYRVVVSTSYFLISSLIAVYSVIIEDNVVMPYLIVIYILLILFYLGRRMNDRFNVMNSMRLFLFEALTSLFIFGFILLIFLNGFVTLTDYFNLAASFLTLVLALWSYYRDVMKPDVSIEYTSGL